MVRRSKGRDHRLNKLLLYVSKSNIRTLNHPQPSLKLIRPPSEPFPFYDRLGGTPGTVKLRQSDRPICRRVRSLREWLFACRRVSVSAIGRPADPVDRSSRTRTRAHTHTHIVRLSIRSGCR